MNNIFPEGLLKAVLDKVMVEWEEANDGYRTSSMGRAAEEYSRAHLEYVVLPAVMKWFEENPDELTKLLLISK